MLLTRSCIYILPLPLCGLYSNRAQNGCGQHRPCKIVLLTLVAPRGVTDLYISRGIRIEHARTTYHETCWTEHQQPYRRCTSQTPYYKWNIVQARPIEHQQPYRRCTSQTPYYKWNIVQARPMSASDASRSLQKVESQPPIGRTHSWRFSIY